MMEDGPHIDQAVIVELREIMGNDFCVLIETFETDSTERMSAIREHVDANKAELVRQVAHSFKGSAANLGASQLATLCQSLEAMGKAGDLTGAADRVQQLEAELAIVFAELQATLSG
jgi:HPt (histidine-containing phosphotransfer) domain-containing protein